MRILSLLFAQYLRQSGWLLKEWAVAERKLNNSVLSDLRCAEVKSGQSDGLRAYCNGHCIFAEHYLYRDFYQSLSSWLHGITYFWLLDHVTNARR